jgi:hypothetical protein
MESAEGSVECYVVGQVVDNAGPVRGTAVTVRDRDLGSVEAWPVLTSQGPITTDDDGRFTLRYSLDQVRRGDFKHSDGTFVADLVFEVAQQPVEHQDFDITLLPDTEPISKDEQRLGIQARRLVDVLLRLNTNTRRRMAGDSELERLIADFQSTFEGHLPMCSTKRTRKLSLLPASLADRLHSLMHCAWHSRSHAPPSRLM